MDCLSLLSKIDDNVIDLAVIDPPYNMKKADWDSFTSENDFLAWTYEWIDALLSKIKPTGSLYIFNTPYNAAFILGHLVSKNMVFQNWITWDKHDGLGASKKKYSNGQETILFFTKSKKWTFNCEEIRVPYESTQRIKLAEKKGILKNGKRWFPNPDGRYCGEVWHFSSERHKNKENGRLVKMDHVTPKPTDMIERIVKASSCEGDLVFDCFVGSGTTAVVAKRLNRNYICGDISEHFVNITVNKLQGV